MFNFSDSFFNKIEKKTNVNKQTILDLASKLQQSDLKNEATLREIIQELGTMTGKEVSKEKEDKIVSAVVNDQVPKDLNKFL
ncbi:MAG: stage VI sporulation protein F [Firmicutes bacterium]|nr:stage VI sporulation protein F [Bacillota bacterium]